MSRENDLEGTQDQGGKHGGQKGMPKPEAHPLAGNEQVSRQDRGGGPSGKNSDAATD